MNSQLLQEFQRVTEMTAISCYSWVGKGNMFSADKAAVDVMRRELNLLPISAKIVIGEGERDNAPMLYIGENLGKGGDYIEIAVDPLECTTMCAKYGFGAMSVMAVSSKGSFLCAPDLYMKKIATGKIYPKDIVDINKSIRKNIENLADFKKCTTDSIVVMVLERDRHKLLLEDIRKTGARIKLINDGDIAGIIRTVSMNNDIDMYVGIGGAPEGVLAAAALKTLGGQMQAKLLFSTELQMERSKLMGIKNRDKIYQIDDLVKNEVIFFATGVTDGYLVDGVKKTHNNKFTTHTLVLNSRTKTVHKIKTGTL